MEQQYQHYKRLVFVALDEDDLAAYRPRALEVAEYCQRFGMEYQELLGSWDLIHKIETALSSTEAISQEFIVVQPGEVLEQSMFL